VYLLIYVSSGEISRVSMALTDTVRLAAGLSAQLAARHNIQVAITMAPPSQVQDSTVGAKDGGIWEDVEGQYMLRYCEQKKREDKILACHAPSVLFMVFLPTDTYWYCWQILRNGLPARKFVAE